MWNSLLVAVGGAIGALLRYLVSVMMKKLIPGYAASGTLLVNVVGCLFIGYLLGVSHTSKSVAESTRMFFVVGILGGLTTFSSLAHETVDLTTRHDSSLMIGLAHLSANLIFGLGAVICGAWLGQEVPPR